MWRTYVICVLIGLLLVSTGGNVLFGRQLLQAQSDTAQVQKRLTAAESAQNSLQAQLDQLKVQAQQTRPQTPVPTVAPIGPSQALLKQIEDDVAGLRGLEPKRDVPLQFLDQQALQRYFVTRFNNDY